MEDITQSKKWGKCFWCSVIAFTLLVCSLVYIIDPYFQFRVRDNQYFMDVDYVNPGLIKNYDYDTVLIGSCMVQNFDMEKFNEELGVNAVKIGTGGLGPKGAVQYIDLIKEAGKAKNYYINMDLGHFAEGYNNELAINMQHKDSMMNEYSFLFKEDPISRLKYSFSYEAWFRFIPVDMGLTVYKLIKGDIPGGKLLSKTSVAHLGEWSDDYDYGEDIVLGKRDSSDEAVYGYVLDEAEQDKLLDVMKQNIDNYLYDIDFSSGNYTFIFPPYSYLYWEDAKAENSYDTYEAAKDYFISEVKKNGGEVYDFQDAEITHDLSYYKNTIHYNKYVNDFMIECMADGEYKR